MTTTTIHNVNTDATPRLPFGWRIESHQGMAELRLELRDGKLYANDREVTRFLCEQQKTGYMHGDKLRQELAGKPVLNAVVLEYLRAHPELIPDDWKGSYTYFWGTIFRDSDARDHVRDLCWVGSGWRWDCRWLDNHWVPDEPAAVLAS